ncbi:MAG: U32 family peptidase [Acidaminococcaceae bacterium]|nr:U32 family peptidase [Acidaminococcaceae bacterium]
MNKQKYLELLAPAGSWEALEAAVFAGADAVYLGGKNFGARQYADNFDNDKLTKAVTFAHLHRVKIFVTVNTLVDDSEMDELAEYLLFLNNIGVDGIIVQDVGVIRVARQIVPDLPLHASTQMTVTNSLGVMFAKNLGMERAVLARELSVKEIEEACTKDIEIETFVHGALCVCYSGQCLMSSLIGGRSGNRGRCAQPCRLPYKLVDKNGNDMLSDKEVGQYLLSPKDLNTLNILPKIIDAGVTSFKIEGRMKRPEYVAVVIDAYRRAIDSYLAGEYNVSQTDFDNIEQIFNRDFTTAYLQKRPGKTMMSHRRPNNRGVLVGRVTEIVGKGQAKIKLEKSLHIGDGLEFWVTVGGRTGINVEKILLNNQEVQSAKAGETVTVAVPKGVRLNDRVFRTLDSELMSYAQQFYGTDGKKRISVKAVVTARLGKPLEIVFSDEDGNVGSGETDFIVETAKKHALNEEMLRKQIDRLGSSEFELKDFVLECDDNVMVPVSEINEARRVAVEQLILARINNFVGQRSKIYAYQLPLLCKNNVGKQGILAVHCDTVDKVKAALDCGANRIIYGGDAFSVKYINDADYAKVVKLMKDKGAEIAFATPRIVKEEQLEYFAKLFAYWEKLQPDFVYINNIGLWNLAKGYKLNLWADHSLNIFNSQALQFWQEQGAKGATLSCELTMAQVGKLASQQVLSLECFVQGRIEMMVSEYCAGGSFLGDLDKGECQFHCGKQLFLEDRQNAKFPVVGDQYCRMHILNSVELSMAANIQEMLKIGVSVFRIDGRFYSVADVANMTNLYAKILNGATTVTENLPNTTRGHYFRGVI